MVFLTALLAGATVAQGGGKKPDIDVTTENYQGWTGAYRISNPRFSLVVVPTIGRIMYAGFRDGKNLLWNSTVLFGQAPNKGQGAYQNFGGDKLWVAPQSLWTWPPDPDLDGSPWTAEPTSDGVKLTSQVSKKFAVQFTRDISLAGNGNVRIRNTMTNKGDKEVELGVWEVTQVDSPTIVAMTAKPNATMPNGWYGYEGATVDNTYVRYDNVKQMLFMQRNPIKSRKFGAGNEDGYIEATLGSGSDTYTFHIEAPYLKEKTYPDNGSAMQVYLNQDPDPFAELEMNSPVVRLRPNQSVNLPVHWQIKRVKL